MKKIVITGGSGFIGTNLINEFKGKLEIYNFDIKKPQENNHLAYWRDIDITDLESLSQEIVLCDPDFIIHLAARTDLKSDDVNEYESNTIGTQNLVKVSKFCNNLSKIIFTSSKFVLPNGYKPSDQFDMRPHTAYGKSKKIGEEYIWNNVPKCDWCIVRPTSIWGPFFDEPYKFFFEYIIKGYYFHIGKNRCYKTYGFIGNAVFQIKQLLNADTTSPDNKVFYLGDYDPYEINEWANEIGDESGRHIPTIPKIIVRTLSYFGDFLGIFNIKFPLTSFRYKNMTEDGINQLDNMVKIAPFLPYKRNEGVKITLKWIKNKV
jgi:nucleoside-diphosphate-sugar epimerase